MVAVHDFRQDLKFSEAASDETFWDAIYRKAFPNLVGHFLCKGDTQSQHMGIDRIIHLANGRTYQIDEKKRRPNPLTGKEYSDILLEYLSNDATMAPGWIAKDLSIDYLAYAFMQSQRVYLYPWPALRRAWNRFGPEWMVKYENFSSQNPGYKTWNVAIPILVLRAAVANASVIQL